MPRVAFDLVTSDEVSPSLKRIAEQLSKLDGQVKSNSKEWIDLGKSISKWHRDNQNEGKNTDKTYNLLASSIESLKTRFLQLASVGTVITFLRQSVKEAQENEMAVNRLKVALTGVGLAFEETAPKVQAFAKEQSSLTRFSQTETLEVLGRMVNATHDLGKAQEATRLVFDLAVSSGKSLDSVMNALAPAISGQAESMLFLNREFGGLVKGAENAQQALEILRQKFKGAADSEKGFTKDLAQSRNEIAEAQQIIGEALLPVLADMAKFTANAAREFGYLASNWKDATKFVLDLSEGIGKGNKKLEVMVKLLEISNPAFKAFIENQREAAGQAQIFDDIHKKTIADLDKTIAKLKQESGAAVDGEKDKTKAAQLSTKDIKELQRDLEAFKKQIADAEKDRSKGNFEVEIALAKKSKEERLKQIKEFHQAGLIDAQQFALMRLQVEENFLAQEKEIISRRGQQLAEFDKFKAELTQRDKDDALDLLAVEVQAAEDTKNQRLVKLNEMFSQGLMSENQYDAARKQILASYDKSLQESSDKAASNFLKQQEVGTQSFVAVGDAAKKFAEESQNATARSFATMLVIGKRFQLDMKMIFQQIAIDAIAELTKIAIKQAALKIAQSIPGPIGAVASIIAGAKKFAHGGIVTKPTLGIVGEAGPEAVIPLNEAGSMGGFNQTLNINITGSVNGAEIAREVAKAVKDGTVAGIELSKQVKTRAEQFSMEAV